MFVSVMYAQPFGFAQPNVVAAQPFGFSPQPDASYWAQAQAAAAAQAAMSGPQFGGWPPQPQLAAAMPGTPFHPQQQPGWGGAACGAQYAAGPQYGGWPPGTAQPQIQQFQPLDAFMQELGIRPEEDVHFGWIAEYGLQSDVLAPSWSIHADPASGRFYYVDSRSSDTTWENPLAPCLRTIIDIGRQYLRAPRDGFFEEQKELLMDQHKRDLDSWHGPLEDAEGRQYFVNSSLGISSWHDPRQETQFFFDIESQVLETLQDTLYVFGPEDLPTFGYDCDRPEVTESGAEILNFDEQKACSSSKSPRSPESPRSPTSPGGTRLTARTARGRAPDQSEHKSMYDKMMKAADHLYFLQKDAEEAQELLIQRKVKERRRRKQLVEEAAENARKQEQAFQKAIQVAEEEQKRELLRQMEEEKKRAEEALKKKLEEEEAARKEADRIAEEARQKALAEEEARRKEEEECKKKEAAKAKKAQEEKDAFLKDLQEVVKGQPDVETLRAALEGGKRQGFVKELEPVRKALKDRLIANLKEVSEGRDVKAMQMAIADGEGFGLEEHEGLELCRKKMEEDLTARREAAMKARKAKEELAGQFKDAQEAQAFGGAVLAAQWRAAVREVAKPFQG